MPNSKRRIDDLKRLLREEYQKPAFKEEKGYWKLKSRVQWLNEGDKSTKYFHAKTMKRRRHNQLKGLEDDGGVWMRWKGLWWDILLS